MAETVNQDQVATEIKTFTQEELDHIVGERLAREREKYSDYDALKDKASRLDELEEASKTELQKMTEKASALEEELNGMKKAAEIRVIRDKVSKETGVPAELLTGETEEACKSQADAIKSYANPSYPQVTDKGEPSHGPTGNARQQFAEWAAIALN